MPLITVNARPYRSAFHDGGASVAESLSNAVGAIAQNLSVRNQIRREEERERMQLDLRDADIAREDSYRRQQLGLQRGNLEIAQARLRADREDAGFARARQRDLDAIAASQRDAANRREEARLEIDRQDAARRALLADEEILGSQQRRRHQQARHEEEFGTEYGARPDEIPPLQTMPAVGPGDSQGAAPELDLDAQIANELIVDASRALHTRQPDSRRELARLLALARSHESLEDPGVRDDGTVTPRTFSLSETDQRATAEARLFRFFHRRAVAAGNTEQRALAGAAYGAEEMVHQLQRLDALASEAGSSSAADELVQTGLTANEAANFLTVFRGAGIQSSGTDHLASILSRLNLAPAAGPRPGYSRADQARRQAAAAAARRALGASR